jgi:hypothetical protein
LAVTLAVAVILDATGWDQDLPFDPGAVLDADLGFFAGFILVSSIIERILELVAPQVPLWPLPAPATGVGTDAAATAQKKADRGFFMLGLAALIGAVLSGACGLYLLTVVGMDVPRWFDIFATGLAIGGGTKTLHELIKALQKAKGTGTTAG